MVSVWCKDYFNALARDLLTNEENIFSTRKNEAKKRDFMGKMKCSYWQSKNGRVT